MINSRKIEDLTPLAQEKCIAWISACKEIGIDVLVYSTYRDAEAQKAEYQKGRRGIPGERVVTYKDGYKKKSRHQDRVAWDAVPLKGKSADWGNTEAYRKMADEAVKLGIQSGFYWSMKDMPHYEI
jgi:hypothetical protein